MLLWSFDPENVLENACYQDCFCVVHKSYHVFIMCHACLSSFIFADSVCSTKTTVSAAVIIYSTIALHFHYICSLLPLSGECLMSMNNNLHSFHSMKSTLILEFLLSFVSNSKCKYLIYTTYTIFLIVKSSPIQRHISRCSFKPVTQNTSGVPPFKKNILQSIELIYLRKFQKSAPWYLHWLSRYKQLKVTFSLF